MYWDLMERILVLDEIFTVEAMPCDSWLFDCTEAYVPHKSL